MLDSAQRELIGAARRAVLVTTAADGRPRPVPIAFAFRDDADGLVVYSAIDEKRKTEADPHALARVRDIGARPRVAILFDHWDEDWTQLAWVRVEGTALVLEPPEIKQIESAGEHSLALSLLRARYAQYATHHLDGRPVIRIAVDRVTGWAATDPTE